VISEPNALNTKFAEAAYTTNCFAACAVTPIVKNTVSFAGTVAPYTTYSAVVGVADAATATRYAVADAESLQIANVDTTAAVAAGTVYNVVFVAALGFD